ncbi:protein kinase superfamily protein [Actinidia rufa]|uniref:Protein kinase superfamily protein n=1 Tax=Actinidia rufa TaxID=165716 RepID=A0A7J0ESR2_9ERIC|nr:protein kinase superfamily protein [Actinidia rufa]
MGGFDYEELEVATENFSPSHLIGKGSHGSVYKGILKDGKLVAVKKQSLGLQKLEDNSKLDNEIRILSSLPQNPYLTTLLGTSHDYAKNKVLVMEHMPNGTLHDSLHVSPTPTPWPRRAQVALQISRAVQFLHQANPLVIHRDIKSANILFDSNWTAKLADFGLAVMQPEEEGRQLNSLCRPAGTIGYLDPCYTTPCRLSTRNDVFSFGVVLLEIISGTKAIDVSRVPASIVEWALPMIRDHREVEIFDKRVDFPVCIEGTVRRMLHIAARCVSSKENHGRPSMGEIVTEMENCLVERVPFWCLDQYFGQRFEKAMENEKYCHQYQHYQYHYHHHNHITRS